MSKLISVIIPVYNVENYLDRCITSVLDQTYTDLEVILVDDGSTDGSGMICDGYMQKDDRVKSIHKKNEGAAAARNVGLKYANGDFISFIDSDDYIDNDMYEVMMKYMKQDVDVVSCGFRLIRPDGKRKLQNTPRTVKKYTFREVVREYLEQEYVTFSVCNKIFKSKLFTTLRFPNKKLHEDVPVMYEIVKNVSGVTCIDQAKYNCYERSGSASRGKFVKGDLSFALFMKDICQDILVRYPEYRGLAIKLYIESILAVINLIGDDENLEAVQIRTRLEKALRNMSFLVIFNKHIDRKLKEKLLEKAWSSVRFMEIKQSSTNK